MDQLVSLGVANKRHYVFTAKSQAESNTLKKLFAFELKLEIELQSKH